jgi:hypothetical protein
MNKLLNLSKLTLKEGKVNIEYSKTFKLPAEAIRFTNGSKTENVEQKTDKILEPLKSPTVQDNRAFFQALNLFGSS